MSIFRQHVIDWTFTFRLHVMHERNQIIIDYVMGLEAFTNRSIGKPWVNVGTIGHVNHGKSVIQTVINNIREANLALIMFGESLQAVNFPFENIELISLDRRYMMAPEDTRPTLLKDNQSWQSMNKGKLSKRARRKV